VVLGQPVIEGRGKKERLVLVVVAEGPRCSRRSSYPFRRIYLLHLEERLSSGVGGHAQNSCRSAGESRVKGLLHQLWVLTHAPRGPPVSAPGVVDDARKHGICCGEPRRFRRPNGSASLRLLAKLRPARSTEVWSPTGLSDSRPVTSRGRAPSPTQVGSLVCRMRRNYCYDHGQRRSDPS
jgi:hypothetical protein